MANTETAELDFDFGTDNQRPGFRLRRLEVLNWGTFGGRVWALHTNEENALLTGDIGSGKSTLVDAITTLLVPSQRIAYNKAAGADNRERSLRSYVLGHYKSERNDLSATAKPVALRDASSYSVILAVFQNAGYAQTITLAQVFWMKDGMSQPQRFYVGVEADFNIAEHFSNFTGSGSSADMAPLRKSLRKSGAEVFDTFPPYGAWFRRRFGIENEQALELFHQTVSMKSVGNLTDFVRSHMLEPFAVEARIAALIGHFDDLNRAHEAVLKAKQQVALLQPLVADCDRHQTMLAQLENYRSSRDALRPYFAGLKITLIEKRIESLQQDLARQHTNVTRAEERRVAQTTVETDLKRSMSENGGDRIEQLGAEIKSKTSEQTRRRDKAERYGRLVTAFEAAAVTSETEFFALRTHASGVAATLETEDAACQNIINEAGVALLQARGEHSQLADEIASLRARRSNIPAEHVAMRQKLCTALGFAESAMPYTAELMQVQEKERDWEGAAERLLRGFGLALLVPDAHYADVAQWVDGTQLRGRLVYFRVRQNLRGEMPALHRDSIARKIDIKPDSPFYDWIERELAARFDYAASVTDEQFRRETRAITRAGQSKTPGERHEKDDRHRLDDRSRFVLGWSNAAKLAVLEAKLAQHEAQMQAIGLKISGAQAAQKALKVKLDAAARLSEYADYVEIDWASLAQEIAQLIDEKQHLESTSNVLKQLAARLLVLQAALAETWTQLELLKATRAKTEQRQADAQALLLHTQAIFAESNTDAISTQFDGLTHLVAEVLGDHQLTVESTDNRERDVRDWLQRKIDAENNRLKTLRDKIIKAMSDYNTAHKLETAEIDASIESDDEYRKMLIRLGVDDLPRFEARFKELLNENTIREVANFQSQLAGERETIRERITHINESLTRIDYNPGRFIALEAQSSLDADVRDFQTELRACTEGALTGSDESQYSEAKFLQVRQIIGRFRGRDGTTELDARWTRKVTDVRNWFSFAASERWREDNTEHEHYSDSGGKSGGQKEKLAYTILAASITYQFGLEWGTARSRTFRFVLIDEAFGRGSDDSAQYGLRLFAQLNLQLLIVTPLQKIHIIEPYVASVGFVQNQNGQDSKIRNLSIAQYREEKQRQQST